LKSGDFTLDEPPCAAFGGKRRKENMQHPTHQHQGSDMSLPCVLLFMCNNAIVGWINTINSAMPVILPWMQFLGLALGMCASGYVIYNQRLNARWKRNQDKNGNQKNRRDAE
jgi:hypothetical protein